MSRAIQTLFSSLGNNGITTRMNKRIITIGLTKLNQKYNHSNGDDRKSFEDLRSHTLTSKM